MRKCASAILHFQIFRLQTSKNKCDRAHCFAALSAIKHALKLLNSKTFAPARNCTKPLALQTLVLFSGNAEKMIADDGSKFTAHTCYKVPFTCSDSRYALNKTPADHTPALRDVAPTVLDILGVEIPAEMDGASLVAK